MDGIKFGLPPIARRDARLFILGSLRIGCVWESIAIPELRGQAETAVRELLSPTAS